MAVLPARVPRELTITGTIGPGIGPRQKLVQEYLCLNAAHIGVDGSWGPATSKALSVAAPGRTSVDQGLLLELARPLLRAIAPTELGKDLPGSIIATAKQHLVEHPLEIGGPNAGPWVRLYMDGNQGPSWPWCAGFATWIVRQAAEAIGAAAPAHLKRTYSCDMMGAAARLAGRLVLGTSSAVMPGSIFLIPAEHPNDWEHTGVIIDVDADTITTIEGNTNDEGSREGYEVCRRFRHRPSVDVILL